MFLVVLAALFGIVEAQSDCDNFYAIAKTEAIEEWVGREVRLADFVVALEQVFPGNELTREPKQFMYDDPPFDYDPNAMISIVCVNNYLFFERNYYITVLNLVSKKWVQSQDLFGIPFEVWQLNSELFAISLFVNGCCAYTVLNIQTGETLLEPRLRMNEVTSSPLWISLELVVGDKALFHDSSIGTVNNEEAMIEAPYTHGLSLYQAEGSNLTKLAECSYIVDKDDIAPSMFALTKQGLIGLTESSEATMYHYRLLIECQDIAELLRGQ